MPRVPCVVSFVVWTMSTALLAAGLVRKVTFNGSDNGWRTQHDCTLGQRLAQLQTYVDPKVDIECGGRVCLYAGTRGRGGTPCRSGKSGFKNEP